MDKGSSMTVQSWAEADALYRGKVESALRDTVGNRLPHERKEAAVRAILAQMPKNLLETATTGIAEINLIAELVGAPKEEYIRVQLSIDSAEKSKTGQIPHIGFEVQYGRRKGNSTTGHVYVEGQKVPRRVAVRGKLKAEEPAERQPYYGPPVVTPVGDTSYAWKVTMDTKRYDDLRKT